MLGAGAQLNDNLISGELIHAVHCDATYRKTYVENSHTLSTKSSTNVKICNCSCIYYFRFYFNSSNLQSYIYLFEGRPDTSCTHHRQTCTSNVLIWSATGQSLVN